MEPGYVAGFVAGEGCFVVSANRRSFTFSVALGAVDAVMCHALHDFFGVGHVRAYPRRREHYDDEVVFVVRKTADLVHVIVPFMDAHLPPSYKLTQYEAWRVQLLDYWQHRARRRRPCTIEGCGEPQRARGVCRHHYFRLFGA